MTLNGTHVMADANHITVITELSSCDNRTLGLNQTIYDLGNLYQSNISNVTSSIFFNVSISNLNCTNGMKSYFEQIITFSQAVSIRIQILFVSIYFDYINAKNYQLNGFKINQEAFINLSSITVNNSKTSNACSSAEVAQDPLCRMNLTHPVCTILSNPWTYVCSPRFVTTIPPLFESTGVLVPAVMPRSLNSWQLGLVCGLSVLFALLLLLLSGFIYRRYRHSKQLALSRVGLYNDIRLMQKAGIPQGQAFQRAATIVQPKRRNHTTISWIDNSTATNSVSKGENYVNIKPPEPYNQVTFVDHAKVYDPAFSSNTPQKSISFVNIPSSPSKRRGPIIFSRPVSRGSMNPLRLITDGLEEDKFNESINISLEQYISSSPKKPNSPILRQFLNLSFIDENLTDEDAWMSILDVVNAELAKLNEQDITRTLM